MNLKTKKSLFLKNNQISIGSKSSDFSTIQGRTAEHSKLISNNKYISIKKNKLIINNTGRSFQILREPSGYMRIIYKNLCLNENLEMKICSKDLKQLWIFVNDCLNCNGGVYSKKSGYYIQNDVEILPTDQYSVKFYDTGNVGPLGRFLDMIYRNMSKK